MNFDDWQSSEEKKQEDIFEEHADWDARILKVETALKYLFEVHLSAIFSALNCT